MTTTPELKLYFKVGIEGQEEKEHTETLSITWDPALTDEQNQSQLQIRSMIAQGRLQAATLEVLMEGGEEFMKRFVTEDD